MGKESLIKSTAKKTGAKKVKTTKKKSSPKASTAKNKKVTRAKAISAPGSQPPNAPEVALRNLLFKQFASEQPAAIQSSPEPDFSNMAAPPLIHSDDPQEAARLHGLLLQKFSMSEIEKAAKAPVESKPVQAPEQVQKEAEPVAAAAKETPQPSAATSKPQPTIRELLSRQFASEQPAAIQSSPEPDFSNMAAPPLIHSDHPQEAARLHGLLLQKFSMSEIEKAAKAPVESKPVQAPEQVQKEAEPVAAAAKETPQPQAMLSQEVPPTQTATPENAPEMPATRHSEINESASSEGPHTGPGEPPSESSPKPERAPADPVERIMKLAAVILAALFMMILWASIVNHSKFYVAQRNQAVEIYRGRFSPTGKKFFVVLHGLQMNTPQKNYTRKEIYPLIFGYYLEKSDSLLEVSDVPAYDSIRTYLEKADKYALNASMRDAVRTRLNNIDRLMLLYKADVAINKNTPESLEAALTYLKQADQLTSDKAQSELIAQKRNLIKSRQAPAIPDQLKPATPKK